jgi:hypothetical protein
MSDSISKWNDMQEEKYITYIFESPDKGATVTRRPISGDISEREVIKQTIVSEGHKEQAYQILIEYPKEAILEAARISNRS